MEYLALYRKYRPKSLSEMVGQDEIKTILLSSITNNKVSHAYLFSGPRGTGKTSTAKIFAKMVNCQHLVDGMPCEKCESCLAIQNGTDVVEIDAASNNGVDEIRDLREKANLVPGVCKYKVYIIDEVHMLTSQAFNALLKTLEEPPHHIIFILATTEYHKVPLTITSRCQKFRFNKISIDDNVRKLREISDSENIDISDDALVEIAKLSDGGMRDSINFLDQIRSYKSGKIDLSCVYDVCGNVSLSEICNLFVDISNMNALGVTNYLESISNNGKSYNNFLEDVLAFLKDIILYKDNVNRSYIKSDFELVNKVSSIYSVTSIYEIIRTINDIIDKLRFSSRQSIVVVTNFLILMNNLFDKQDTCETEVKLTFLNDESKPKENEETSTLNEQVNIIENKNNSLYYVNKDIIINNAFATADKKLKEKITSKWSNIKDYLLDKKYSLIASKLNDTNIEVVGSKYIIFSTTYESIISYLYDNDKLCSEFLNTLFGDEYYFVFINDSSWNEYKDKYIKDYKNNIKYTEKEINFEKNDDIVLENTSTNDTAVDKLIDIVGDDLIEYK